jgi:predicted nucleic acid-binding Zn ribbon protein
MRGGGFMADNKHRRRVREGTKKEPEPFGSALETLVHQLGLTKKMKQAAILSSWAGIVGEQIARVTEAERIENGILFVKTLNAPWRNELSMRRLQIIEKLNAAVGSRVVKEIRFR